MSAESSYNDVEGVTTQVWDFIRSSRSNVIDTSNPMWNRKDSAESLSQALDLNGVDGVSNRDDGLFGFGIRVHEYNEKYGPSWGVRYTNRSGEGISEFDKLFGESAGNGAIKPIEYFVGQKKDGRLKNIYIVDIKVVRDALNSGRISYRGPYPSNRFDPQDKSEAVYFDITDLCECRAISVCKSF
jgi:hypothetical protein